MHSSTRKHLGRAIVVVGVAVVALAGWLKAEDDSLAVFGLLVLGGLIWLAGAVMAGLSRSKGERDDAPGPRGDDVSEDAST
jgi:hypothetical protein